MDGDKESASYILATRALRTTPTLDVEDLQAFAEAAGLDREQTQLLGERVAAARHAVQEAGLAERFAAAPLSILLEVMPELRDRIPEELRPLVRDEVGEGVCAEKCPTGIYDACVGELLRRVLLWVSHTSGNRAAFEADPGTAVEAVRGTAPAEAVVLAKNALERARRFP